MKDRHVNSGGKAVLICFPHLHPDIEKRAEYRGARGRKKASHECNNWSTQDSWGRKRSFARRYIRCFVSFVSLPSHPTWRLFHGSLFLSQFHLFSNVSLFPDDKKRGKEMTWKTARRRRGRKRRTRKKSSDDRHLMKHLNLLLEGMTKQGENRRRQLRK